MLKIKNLHVAVEGKSILKGVDLQVRPGEVHAIMGPNGSGKSTLAYVLAGHPRYEVARNNGEILRLPRLAGRAPTYAKASAGRQDDHVERSRHADLKSLSAVSNDVLPGRGRPGFPSSGAALLRLKAERRLISAHGRAEYSAGSRWNKEPAVVLNGRNLLKMTPDERARLGLFLAFQYPVSVDGVSVEKFLRRAYEARTGKKVAALAFRKKLTMHAEALGIKTELLTRSLNDGFSGGEKKRVEILQLAVLKPKLAILDETDSGLDVDALKAVAKGVRKIVRNNPTMGVLLITHYQRILKYLRPDFVHVMIEGRIVESGDEKLAQKVERKGYKN